MYGEIHLFVFFCRWQLSKDQKEITDRLTSMSLQGINTANIVSLIQAIHELDPRTETM